MWPKLLDMSKDECKRLLRRTELEAYAGIISAFRAQGDLTKDKKKLLNDLSATLSISTERHRAEVRRAVNDEKLSTVAERLNGPNNSSEWSIEGRRLIPLMPRLVPQTVFSLTANQAANAAFSHNLTLPVPSETAKRKVSNTPIQLSLSTGNENNDIGVKPHQPPSPSSNVVVLPSGLSIPVKGTSDVDFEGPPVKRLRHESSNSSLSKESMSSAQVLNIASSINTPITKPSSGHVITTSRSLSLPANKQPMGFNTNRQHGGLSIASNKSLIGLNMTSNKPSPVISNFKPGLSTVQSPVKFNYTKSSSSTGNTTGANSAQKVILVSSSSTSFTPSILQRSHSVPSTKSPVVKPGIKQSVILTSMSGQSLARKPDMVSSVKQATTPSIIQRGRQQNTSFKSNIRQQASLSGRQLEVSTAQISSGLQITTPDVMPGAIPVISTSRKSPANIGTLPAIKSTVITARTTTSLISSQMASYVSTNMVGKPRGRAVSKQKVVKQIVHQADMTPSMLSGVTNVSKKQHVKQDTGVKVVNQSLGTTNKQQKSLIHPHGSMETSPKASMSSAALATAKPVTTIAGNKVIIGTSSAGVVSHLMAATSPVSRTKPSVTMSSIGSVNLKTVQTIKATTTANVGQTVTSVTHVISSKPSLVMMQKSFPQGSHAQITESSKQSLAHNIMTSSLLQRPRIAMVTGVTATTASSLSTTSIRFPALQSTNNIAMTTTVKSPGSKRIRSPITLGTATNPSNQRRSVTSVSQNTLQGSKIPGSYEEIQSSKQDTDFQGNMKRGLLTSCTHPNSEWIDYDGSPPDASASSAIKALLEFRSHPDVSRRSQIIDLSCMGSSSSSTTRAVCSPAVTAIQSSTAPSRLPQTASVTSRVSPHETSTGGSPQQLEGVSQISATLLSNMQSKLKKALISERPGKSATSATFLQTATMEVEKALQEQNKALLAKHEGSIKHTEISGSQLDERTRGPAGLSDFTVHKKMQQERSTDSGQHVTVEDQGVVTERVNLSSEDVSSFVDQFEQFLESESLDDDLKGVVSGGQVQNRNDQSVVQRSSESSQQTIDSFQLIAGNISNTSTERTEFSGWSDESVNQSAVAELAGPSWRNKTSFDPIVSSGRKVAASVVMESGSVDISHMKIEDFTSQRLQDEEEEVEKRMTSPDTSPVKIQDGCYTVRAPSESGSDERSSSESHSVRISSRKRKAPAPIDDEPGPTSMSSWARAAFNLLQRVMRFRGANRSKGDLNAASWFTRPVAAAEAPGYNRVIKNPMDFGTVKRKLESGQYDDFSGFHNDMMLVHNNCVDYNPPGHEIRRDCEEVFQFYTLEYNKLTERRDKPSPKKSKPDDHHSDKGKSTAVRLLSVMK